MLMLKLTLKLACLLACLWACHDTSFTCRFCIETTNPAKQILWILLHHAAAEGMNVKSRREEHCCVNLHVR
jgi:hypothetical protein